MSAQEFRCPNRDCTGAYTDYSDLKMFVYYFTDDTSKINDISLPPSNASNMEVAVSDCYLKAVSVNDYPCFDDYGNELNEIEAIYGEKLLEKYLDQLSQSTLKKPGMAMLYTISL